MAGRKISELGSASALTGSELVPVVQSGTTAAATVDQFMAALEPVIPVVLPAQIASRTGWGPFVSDDETKGTGRTQHEAACDCTDLRLVFQNAHSGEFGQEVPGDAVVTYRAVVDTGTNLYPVTFGGAPSADVEPGAMVVSDPVGLTLAKGETFHVRTYAEVQSGHFALNLWSRGAAFEEGYVTDDGLSGDWEDDTVGACPGPVAVWADTLAPIRVALIGDSNTSGINAAPEEDHHNSAVQRALHAAGVPSTMFAVAGQFAAQVATGEDRVLRSPLLAGCTHALVSLGGNDLVPLAGQTAADVKASLEAVWAWCRLKGMRPLAATLPPRTTSSDDWATVENQTPLATEADRQEVNAWLRGGADSLIDGLIEWEGVLADPDEPSAWRADGQAWTLDGVHLSAYAVEQAAAALDLSPLLG